MDVIKGTSNKVLEINLTSKKYTTYTVSNAERKLYLGGKGLGLKLLFDRLKPGIDPLGAENMLAVMPGVLESTGAPCTARFSAVTKSPLTGIMASANCGGPFGGQLKTAGWDGILIRGKAKKPIFLHINHNGVSFEDAGGLWGMDAQAVQDEVVGNKKNHAALAIGPAGENLVRFANIVSGKRYLGRGGMGAVMGSKMLKAIVVEGGKYKIEPVRPYTFKSVRKKALAYINRNDVTAGSYRNFGTPYTINLSNAAGILPINNFTIGSDRRAVDIAGETFAAAHEASDSSCKTCAIRCGHKGTFNGKTAKIPEYESIVLMGSNLGIFDREKIVEWNNLCGKLGMDTISAGGTLAWVMEATQKGMVDSDLTFGSAEGISEALHDIAYAKGFGKEMGLGSRALSQKYGGEDFAIHVKGLELPAYDPRGSVGLGLAYAVANRGGCHLSSYVVALEVFFGLMDPYAAKAKPEMTIFFESLNNCINSMGTCLFTQFAYTMEDPLTKMTPDLLLGMVMQHLPQVATKLVNFSIYKQLWSTTTGISISNGAFLKAGDRIHVLERLMNTREGIAKKDDTLPARLLKEGRKNDPKRRTVPLEKMLDHYYDLRGFDSNGIPTRETLERLKIETT